MTHPSRHEISKARAILLFTANRIRTERGLRLLEKLPPDIKLVAPRSRTCPLARALMAPNKMVSVTSDRIVIRSRFKSVLDNYYDRDEYGLSPREAQALSVLDLARGFPSIKDP